VSSVMLERSPMNVSPLDLRQQRFRTVVRGFDRTEVVAFLAEVADDYEAALHETDRLRQDVTRLEALLNEHREAERNLRNTLLTAQRLADEIREAAQDQARKTLEEAESRSNLILEKAQARLEDVQREIDGLRMKRREVENSLESTIAAVRGALDFVREQDVREREEKVLLHRPRPADNGQAHPWTSRDQEQLPPAADGQP
jgi:cell division initiation protein